MADDKTGGANESVSVTGWNACYNSGDGVISLSCTLTTSDSSAAISGVGLNKRSVALARPAEQGKTLID